MDDDVFASYREGEEEGEGEVEGEEEGVFGRGGGGLFGGSGEGGLFDREEGEEGEGGDEGERGVSEARTDFDVSISSTRKGKDILRMK